MKNKLKAKTIVALLAFMQVFNSGRCCAHAPKWLSLKPTNLHLIAKSNNLEGVKRSIEQDGIDQSIKTSDAAGLTPLHYAAYYGSLDVAEYLIKQGVGINERSNYLSYTPLHFAAEGRNLRAIKFFLKKYVDVDIRDSLGETPLFKVISNDCIFGKNDNDFIEPATLLICKGTNVNAVSNEGQTVLMTAAVENNIQAVDFLLSYGANPNLIDIYGESILHYAASKENNEELVEHLILDDIIDKDLIDQKGIDGRTPIFYTVYGEIRFKMLKTFIDLDADTSVKDENKNTLLHVAVSYDENTFDPVNDNYVDLLVKDCGIDINAQNACGQTALSIANELQNYEVADYLIRLGAKE